MVDIGDYEPKNPLNVELPLDSAWPPQDFDLAKGHGDDTIADLDPIRAGLYAWAIYGVMITVNNLYYSDQYYYWVTMRGGWSRGSFRTWWNVVVWLRMFTLCYGWTFA